MGDAFWLRGNSDAESVEARRRAQRIQLKDTLQAAVRSVVRQAAQIQEPIPQPFPLWPGPLCDAFLHGLKPGKDLFLLLITRFPELLPPKPTSSTVSTSVRVAPIVAAALKMQPAKALPATVQGSLIEDNTDMVDKTVIKGDVVGAFLTQARRVLPLLSSSESKCLALIAIGLNLSFLSALLLPVFGNAELRKNYYEDWAFMRDSDDVVLLAAMLHTLDPLDFAISPAPDRLALYLAPPAAPEPEHAPVTLGSDAAPVAPKRRAKKKIANIIDQTALDRRQREEEEREEQELRESVQRELALRDEAARAMVLEAARQDEVRRKEEAARRREELRAQEERAEKEAERQKQEKAEREAQEAERREEELKRQLAEQMRRNEELLRDKERLLDEARREEQKKRDDERRQAEAERARLAAIADRVREEEQRRAVERRKLEEAEAAEAERRKVRERQLQQEREAARKRLQEIEAEAVEEARRGTQSEERSAPSAPSAPLLPSSPPTAGVSGAASLSASYSSLAAMERSDALACASSSGGEERRSETDEERLAALKAARVEAMRRRIAEDVELRLKRELGANASSASVAALIFSSSLASSAPTSVLSRDTPPSSLSPVVAQAAPQTSTTPVASIPSTSGDAAMEPQRKREEEEEMNALRLAAERQREREEKQRQELLLKKRMERERQEEERRREEARIREETQRRVEEEQAAREEETRRKEAARQEEERRMAALEAQQSDEIKRELARQEELRRQRAERERLEAIREQQAAAAVAAVRKAEEEAQVAREREEAARRAKEKEEAKGRTEAERAQALRALLSDMLAPKKKTDSSASPPASAALAPPLATSPVALSTPLALSRSEPTLPSLPSLPLSVSRPVPIPQPMRADLPSSLPLPSPSPPNPRPSSAASSSITLPPLPSPASTLAPAAVIAVVQDSFSFFEDSDSGPETVPELRGTWRTIVGQHDSSDLFASTALAAAPLLRMLRGVSPARGARGPSPRPAPRSVSPQVSPRGQQAAAKFVWAPPRKQLYFRLESQRPAQEQGNVCYACGKALPARPLYCEYTNKWFCAACHTGAKHVIPARVLHNWDLRPYPVSDFASAFLQSIAAEAVMDVGTLNPGLYELVPQLSLVKAFRRKLGWMKNYVLACREQAALLRPFLRAGRSHLLYSTEMYALKDFLDLSAATLLPFLEETYQAWLLHFPRCELCRARAIVCELCRGEQGLFFPWERGVARCPRCDSFFHRSCTATRRGCPRCARDRAKQQLSARSVGGM